MTVNNTLPLMIKNSLEKIFSNFTNTDTQRQHTKTKSKQITQIVRGGPQVLEFKVRIRLTTHLPKLRATPQLFKLAAIQ